RYPQDYIAALRIRLHDGSERSLLSDCPSGDPDARRYKSNPDLLRREVGAKVGFVLAECGFGERVDALERCVGDLVSAADLAELCRTLGARRSQPLAGQERLGEPFHSGRT